MDTRINLDKIHLDTSAPDKTVVTILYSSDEPAHPVWGGGVKQKTYPPTVPTAAIIPQICGETGVEYIHWQDAPPAVAHWMKEQPGAYFTPDWRHFDRTSPAQAEHVMRAVLNWSTGELELPDANRYRVRVPQDLSVTTAQLAHHPAYLVTFGRHDPVAPWVALSVEPAVDASR